MEIIYHSLYTIISNVASEQWHGIVNRCVPAVKDTHPLLARHDDHLLVQEEALPEGPARSLVEAKGSQLASHFSST